MAPGADFACDRAYVLFRGETMDIWAYKVISGLGGTVPLVWIMVVIALITLGFRWERRPLERNRTKRLVKMLIAILGTYILLLCCAALVSNLAVDYRFDAIALQQHDKLVIRSDRGSVAISDPSAIAELLQMIRNGQSVWAHHSHPVHEMDLSFPDIGYTYALGRDSERDGEFWLTWVAYEGSSALLNVHVRQFHSKELADWLEKDKDASGASKQVE